MEPLALAVRGKGFEMEDLEFAKAPRENLDTWGGMKKLIVVVAGVQKIGIQGEAGAG